MKYVQNYGVELLSSYRPGGYHPVHIGDIFQDRYLVVDKLGFGTFATTWLIKDLITGRLVALKVLVANAPEKSAELATLHHLKRAREGDESSSGREFIMQFFDDFQVEGPNGTHQCIVAEFLGPNLASACDMYELQGEEMPAEIGKAISAQLALGVAYLHRQGVIHGDLHLDNILLQIPDVDSWFEKDVQTYFGEPLCRPILRQDSQPLTSEDCKHLPRYHVARYVAKELVQLCLSSVNSAHIKICDFGEAFLWDGAPKVVQLGTPGLYAAPEVVFQDAISPATDIWALAVLIHMILSQASPLFYSYDGDETEVIVSMVKALGKFPEKWWTKWESRPIYFDEAGTYIGDPGNHGPNWVRAPAARSEHEEFEKTIRKMARYEPEERIAADEVARLLSSWLPGGSKN